MLANLKIENVAVIEKAEVNFTPGFNVLTGETGAGKSILIDSINAILGNRTSRELVRSGAQKACIWATFERIPDSVKKQLEKCGYEANDDLLLYREINAEGKGSCRVNGMPATAAVVRDISAGLLSIHGQHDSQSLTNPALHLGLLDQYAQNRALFAEYYRRYRELVTVKRQLDALNASESDKQRRIEALTAEIDTIDAAALQPGEEKTLQERKNVITHAQSILEGITAAHLALAGDEDGEQSGAADLLGGAVDGLQNSARLDETLAPMSERLNDLYYSARELATDLADRLDAYGFDTGELDQIESRLDTIYRIKQKFGMEVDELLARADRMCLAQRLFRAGELPKRVTHCDTKVNNILFDEQDRPLCVIDLDTTMPGFVLSDFGDFIRTAANTGAEDDPDLDKVDVDMDIFRAFAKGYVESTASFLTPVERENLPYGAQLLTYMQTVRFLADYLDGDNYYKIKHPEHNWQRSKAQFKLLQSIEAQEKAMNDYIAGL